MTDERRRELESTITACKDLLAQTDYEIVKTADGLVSCKSATEITNFLKNLDPKIVEIIAHRARWRVEINAAEEELGGDDVQ